MPMCNMTHASHNIYVVHFHETQAGHKLIHITTSVIDFEYSAKSYIFLKILL